MRNYKKTLSILAGQRKNVHFTRHTVLSPLFRPSSAEDARPPERETRDFIKTVNPVFFKKTWYISNLKMTIGRGGF